MPPIYKACCSSCGYESSEIFIAEYQALIGKENEIIPLPHPREAATLHSHHYTFDLAGILGRYGRVSCFVCHECGATSEFPRLLYPLSPIAYLLGPIAVLIFGFSRFGFSISSVIHWVLLLVLGVMCGLLLSFILSFLLTPVVRLLYNKRAKAIRRIPQCVECGSNNIKSLERSLDVPLPCPSCSERSLIYKMCGMS